MKNKLAKSLLFSFILGVLLFTPALLDLQAKSLLDSLFGTSPNDTIQFEPNISIPGSDFVQGSTSDASGNLAGRYIAALYKFFVGIAGIIAVIMIAFGGFLWLFSGGSSEKIAKAKEIIFGSLIGLILAVGSYLILYTINPQLVDFKLAIPEMPEINSTSQYCSWKKFSETNAENFYGDCGERFSLNIGGLEDQAGCIFTRCDSNQVCLKEGLVYRCVENTITLNRLVQSYDGNYERQAVSLYINGDADLGGSCGNVGSYSFVDSSIEQMSSLCTCNDLLRGSIHNSYCVVDRDEGNLSFSSNSGLWRYEDSGAQCPCE